LLGAHAVAQLLPQASMGRSRFIPPRLSGQRPVIFRISTLLFPREVAAVPTTAAYVGSRHCKPGRCQTEAPRYDTTTVCRTCGCERVCGWRSYECLCYRGKIHAPGRRLLQG